jgi:15-cis-phytoene synthase
MVVYPRRFHHDCMVFLLLLQLTELAFNVVVAFQPVTWVAQSSIRCAKPCWLLFVGSNDRRSIRTMTLHPSSIRGKDTALKVVATTTTATTIEELMSQYDPILLFASRLLPPDTAADASALYAWCRRLDEICDAPGADPEETQRKLDDWEQRLDLLWEGNPVDEMDAALTACIRRHSYKNINNNNNNKVMKEDVLTQRPFRDMIAGMRSDAISGGRRVATMEELEEYAYQVAGTVGLMLLPLFKVQRIDRASEPAICLGKAIQLINILRDASPDSALGRIYLPQDQLRAYNVQDDDVLVCQCSEGYRRVVQSVAIRATQLLQQAEAGRSTLPGPLGPLFVQVIVELYRGYLDELERRGYDNLTAGSAGAERVKISTVQKLGASWKAVRKILLKG